jgi:crotonobetainyl-CoA:carnitine CoA-transferase CaiB-like acyl-CoA transferase
MSGALDGILVADFTRVLAGPYATMLLADLGADVVKVERPPAGDDTRAWGPPYTPDGQATYFQSVNRNKRSAALDMTDAEDRLLARELADRADVVVHNLRPGTMERWGLGFEQLSEQRPDIVYCSISGFGSGVGAALPGYDLLAQAVGGLMSMTGEPGSPTKVGVAIVDVITGLHATIGILAALRHRDRTGVGQLVEVDLLTSLLSSLVNHASAYVTGGVLPVSTGNAHASIAPYEPVPTRDRPLVLAVGNDGQFGRLCEVVGRRGLAADERFVTNSARVRNRVELIAELTRALAARDADDWQVRLTEAGVPCGPINDIEGAFTLAASLGLAPISAYEGAVDGGEGATTSDPIRLSITPARYRTPPPGMGADSDEVKAWLRLERE